MGKWDRAKREIWSRRMWNLAGIFGVIGALAIGGVILFLLLQEIAGVIVLLALCGFCMVGAIISLFATTFFEPTIGNPKW